MFSWLVTNIVSSQPPEYSTEENDTINVITSENTTETRPPPPSSPTPPPPPPPPADKTYDKESIELEIHELDELEKKSKTEILLLPPPTAPTQKTISVMDRINILKEQRKSSSNRDLSISKAENKDIDETHKLKKREKHMATIEEEEKQESESEIYKSEANGSEKHESEKHEYEKHESETQEPEKYKHKKSKSEKHETKYDESEDYKPENYVKEHFNIDNFVFDFEPTDIHKRVRFKEESLEGIPELGLALEDRTKVNVFRGYDDIKNLMNNKFGSKEIQFANTLTIIALYMKGQKILYLEAKSYCEFYLYRLMIPTIFISTLCSVISGIIGTSSIATYIVSAASGLNTILLALINYFKLDARSEAHRMTAFSFDQLISECEFTSGKVLLSNDISNPNSKDEKSEKPEIEKIVDNRLITYDLRFIQDFVSDIEKKLKEIKQKNQFLIPDVIRFRFPKCYNTNIFESVKDALIEEMVMLNYLKVAAHSLTEVENRIIKGVRTPQVYQEYHFKYQQKNQMINKLIQFRSHWSNLNDEFRHEIEQKNSKSLGFFIY